VAQGEGGGGSAALASCGSLRWRSRAKLGGGSRACFARVARLALVRVGEVLGWLVRWRGNRWQRWRVGGGASVLGRRRLRVSGDLAGWCWGGRFSGVVLRGASAVAHWWGQGRCHGVGAGALVSEGEGPDNQQEVEGGRREWGATSTSWSWGGG
jgi:hypothetical protein